MKRPVALVTGGTRGIGFGCAKALAGAGFDLAINGVRPPAQAAGALAELGARAIYCQGSIADGEARRSILDTVRAEFGALHVLVNNAGIAPRERRDILETTESSFDEVLATNLRGPYFLTQAAARWMLDQRRDSTDAFFCIINIGSISATVASINRGEYCLAKAGIAMMTALFAVRLGAHGIPVYELRPGVTKTDMTSGVTEKYDKLIAGGLCLTQRWGHPEDVGRAVRALACGEFPYSTGQVFHIDGGLTIPRL